MLFLGIKKKRVTACCALQHEQSIITVAGHFLDPFVRTHSGRMEMVMKIALISCSKLKRSYTCMAKELYSPSELFSASYQYAKTLKVDKIYIISTKHGLIHEDAFIAPYELSMKDWSENRTMDWANGVKNQIDKELNPREDEFIVLTETECLTPLLKVKAFEKFVFPLRDMNVDTKIAYMNNEVEKQKP